MLYVYEGLVTVGSEDPVYVAAGHGALLTESGKLSLAAVEGPARVLLLAGLPLREPVVQYGPFVMNTREEIQQAIEDFESGRLAR